MRGTTLDKLEITEHTDRDLLLAYINDLEEVNNRLQETIQDKDLEIESLSIGPAQQRRLEEAADLMADLGKIINTPWSKRRWIEGY